MINGNLETFGGLPVRDYAGADEALDFAQVCPRLRCSYDDELDLRDKLVLLLEQPGVESMAALVLGMWAENGDTYEVSPQPVLDMLVAFKHRLPALTALFAGDIVSEENEISWIGQGDYSALWSAFPRLTEIGIRGSDGLSLGTINHQSLRKIAIESGGLDLSVIRQALFAKAPIEHFEIWTGDDGYGANSSVETFGELFAGNLFPQLTTLALRNSQYANDIAAAVAASPLLERIKVLDLSLGALTDEGAQALAASGRLGHLERLDISFHYVSDEMVSELAQQTPNLVADDKQTPDDWDDELHYYIAVSE